MLTVDSLSVSFDRYQGLFGRTRITPVQSLSLTVAPGEVVALVGESGAGKSLLASALLGLLPANAHTGGTITFDGAPLTPARAVELRGTHIALVPQSVSALNPLLRAATQVRGAAQACGWTQEQAHTRTHTALQRYGVDGVGHHHPHALSGGQARRMLTAAATVSTARLIIADEPTCGLHGEALSATLNHLRELADDSTHGGRGVLLITHDLAAACEVADRIVVVQGGRTVDTLPATQLAADGATHPYTVALWQACTHNTFMGEAPCSKHAV